jgi:hypothetical protein
MALEALVILPTRADTVGELYRAGDILVLAVAGHPWSDLERKQFQVIDYIAPDAATMEAKVRAAGGVMPYPFAVMVDGAPRAEGEPPTKKMVNVCSKEVDLTLIPDKDREVDQPRQKITAPVITPRIERVR